MNFAYKYVGSVCYAWVMMTGLFVRQAPWQYDRMRSPHYWMTRSPCQPMFFTQTRTHTRTNLQEHTPHCPLKYVTKDNGGWFWLWNTVPRSTHTQIQKSTCECVYKKIIWLCMNLSLVTVRKVFMGVFAS